MSQQAVDFRVSYENVLDLTRPIDDAFEATTQELSNSDTTQAPPARKVALNDLTWLLPHNTTVTVNNKEYIVGLNQVSKTGSRVYLCIYTDVHTLFAPRTDGHTLTAPGRLAEPLFFLFMHTHTFCAQVH